MANKPEFVDMISEATRQNRRRAAPRVIAPAPEKEEKALSNWPPARFARWRLENLTPWKMRSWKIKDWV